ncbi:chemotaxis response regulator protein-glutamate methylesterase [Evansella sp. AB-rgal1]|uniref:protein-glutamate methylesterase/protein-glutamine glutaminase n=1 Tax=Evansella sp. AB-rgal1 TaxID=3242696 RepID=UPI00359D270C
MIKVLVVDDSAFMRKVISDLLEEEQDITVVDRARNGEDALKKIKLHHPDVITLDVEMPIMNGIEALQMIMKEVPTPVIMVSSTTVEGADTTIRAMEYGAFDFIPKPSGPISLDIHKVKEDLVLKIKLAAKVPLSKLHSVKSRIVEAKDSLHTQLETYEIKRRDDFLSSKGIVAIGTSTGGPRALQQILTTLPSDFPFPIVIVQHMPTGFTKSLSKRLNDLSKITVKEAENGDILKKGIAYIAPGGLHLKVRKIGMSLGIQLDSSETVHGHRPSVDTMFSSLATLPNVDVLAIVLTGMGTDGTKGLELLKKSQRVVAIAESQNTAVVFGMPRAVIQSNLVDLVVDIDQISTTIMKQCSGR